MAQRSKLAVILNGLPQNVDLSADELVLDSVRLGGGSGTLLTKAILDGLISNSHAPMSDNQNIIAGDGLTGGGSGASVTIDVDDSVIRADGSVAFTADQSMGTKKITNLGEPVADTDAATKQYVDGAIAAAAPDAADVVYSNTISDLTATNVQDAIDELDGRLDTAEGDLSTALGDISTLQSTVLYSSAKGAANGVAELDANGLVPITQLPPAALERLVIVANQAARYALTTATAQNGDTVKQSDTGELFFVKDDTNLGNSSGYEVYVAGSASSVPWSGVTSTPTTLSGYGITDAQPYSANLDEASTFFASTDLSAAEAEQLSNGSNADSLHSHAQLKKTMVAGESFAANTSFLVRLAISGETAGRVYKATSSNAAADKKFWAIGMVKAAGAVSAGDEVEVMLLGSHTLGSSDVNFNSSDVGLAVWLTTAGGFSVTSPSSSGDASFKVGTVESTTKILVDNKQLMGIN